MLSSSKVFVRKKAIGVILRVFGKYPDAVRVCFKRLVENLEGSDSQIVSVTVGVFCELASKDPRSYLPLAPEFYRILVDSRNNWVLIKVLKIFAKLAPLEPRLAKKVVEPICDHMNKTGAKSLVFECIRTVVTSLTDYASAVKLAVTKVREMLIDDDPNLKYLALQALRIVAPNHLWAVMENKDVVIKSLSDEDPNIKLESLRLVMMMVSESNVAEISRVLLNYALKSDPEFSNEILGSILSTCRRNVYEIVIDFDWYVSLLGEMSRILHCQKGDEIEKQLIDIGMRVKDVRPELVQVARDLLIDPALLGNPFLHKILAAAAWVSGEYVELSKNPFELIEALLQPRTNLLPPLIRAVYLQSAFKVLVFCLHSYLLQRGATASTSCSDNLAPRGSQLLSERDSLVGSDLATRDASAPSEQEDGFNPRVLHQSSEDLSVDYGEETNVSHGRASTSDSLRRNNFNEESIMNLLNLTELAVSPLSGSLDVEVQERAGNILSFIELIKQKMHDSLAQKEESLDRDETEVSEIIKIMHGAFLNDLGPVSVNAQERVPVPDGLLLKQNLEDLETICPDDQLPISNSLSFGNLPYEERDGDSIPILQRKEESQPSNESTSLLSEHCKRHGLFYLPSEKSESGSNDYPPANDLKSQSNLNYDAEDLVKLTDQSPVPKRKPNHAKTRPVVVKLDEGDQVPIAAKPRPKVDSLSGAVRDALLAGDTKDSLSESKPSDRSSTRRKGKEKLNVDSPSESKERLDDVVQHDGEDNPSSRKIKHHKHGKERRQRSTGNVVDERDENGQKGKQKTSHRHGKHKGRQKADVALNVVPQTQVIPDFLL